MISVKRMSSLSISLTNQISTGHPMWKDSILNWKKKKGKEFIFLL